MHPSVYQNPQRILEPHVPDIIILVNRLHLVKTFNVKYPVINKRVNCKITYPERSIFWKK